MLRFVACRLAFVLASVLASGGARAGEPTCGPLAVTPEPLCEANALFASTAADAAGDVDFLVVDRDTGAASYDFTFNVGAGNVLFGFVYHDTLDRFVWLIYADGSFLAHSLGFLDRAARSATLVPITGVPGGAPNHGAIVYDPFADRMLASFSDDGSSMEDQIVELLPDGSAGLVSTVIGEDMDGFAHRRTTGELFGWDPNTPTGPRLFELSGLFDALAAGPLAPLPFRDNIGALASDPGSDALYMIDRTTNGLVRIDGLDTYVDIGPFGISEPIRGLNFGPAVVCGDGVVDPDEDCDDGNTTPGDGCDDECRDEIAIPSCPDSVPLTGEVKAKIALEFSKPDRDQVQLKGKGLALPSGFAVPADVQLDVGGIAIDASLDAKGKWKNADGRDKVKLKQSKKDGSWKLSAKRKKSDLAGMLSDEGLADEDHPKPGTPVTVAVCLTADAQNHARELSLSYRSKATKSGKAK